MDIRDLVTQPVLSVLPLVILTEFLLRHYEIHHVSITAIKKRKLACERSYQKSTQLHRIEINKGRLITNSQAKHRHKSLNRCVMLLHKNCPADENE